jgi:hypothetical protein
MIASEARGKPRIWIREAWKKGCITCSGPRYINFGAIYDTVTALLLNRLTVSGCATLQLKGGKPRKVTPHH